MHLDRPVERQAMLRCPYRVSVHRHPHFTAGWYRRGFRRFSLILVAVYEFFLYWVIRQEVQQTPLRIAAGLDGLPRAC
jgi:hypothetical protein